MKGAVRLEIRGVDDGVLCVVVGTLVPIEEYGDNLKKALPNSTHILNAGDIALPLSEHDPKTVVISHMRMNGTITEIPKAVFPANVLHDKTEIPAEGKINLLNVGSGLFRFIPTPIRCADLETSGKEAFRNGVRNTVMKVKMEGKGCVLRKKLPDKCSSCDSASFSYTEAAVVNTVSCSKYKCDVCGLQEFIRHG